MTLREFTQLSASSLDIDVDVLTTLPTLPSLAEKSELPEAFQQGGMVTLAGRVAEAMRLSALQVKAVATEETM